MEISPKEIKHIAKLADLKINEEEIDKYILNLQDILNYANTLDTAPIEGLDVTIGAIEKSNVFRKDEIIEFTDKQSLLQNAEQVDDDMFKIPKVIQ